MSILGGAVKDIAFHSNDIIDLDRQFKEYVNKNMQIQNYFNQFTYRDYHFKVSKIATCNYEGRCTEIPELLIKGNTEHETGEKLFRYIDKVIENTITYNDVCKEWGSNCKKVTYKNRVMWVKALKRAKDKRLFYIGTFCDLKSNVSSFESIHYDKVVSRFQRFVDEYCTDWVVFSSIDYKNYTLVIKRDRNDCDRFFGTCEIHKNSTFKCISNSLKEIEEKFKVRIDRMIDEKEKVQRKMLTPKQEKIKELEQLLARISTQLEELKKEKDTLTYKGIVLEIIPDIVLSKGVLRGVNNPALFVEGNMENLKKSFEKYIDKLEASYNLYRKLTGKEE